jgi:hypothetical protein
MARSSLPPPVARALAEAFDEHDRRHGERGRALAAVGEDLARRFGAR